LSSARAFLSRSCRVGGCDGKAWCGRGSWAVSGAVRLALLLAVGNDSPQQTAQRASSGLAPGAGGGPSRLQKRIGSGSGSHTWAAWHALVLEELSMRADRQENTTRRRTHAYGMRSDLSPFSALSPSCQGWCLKRASSLKGSRVRRTWKAALASKWAVIASHTIFLARPPWRRSCRSKKVLKRG
jgi:hypothetical protein